ncbi:MAG: adenylosuccinate lyase [Oscillospiraceae bacterium]|jgi:adenylosuccinate lyase
MNPILPRVSKLFSRDGRFDRWLRVEAALANAQAELGIIPKHIASDIDAAAHVEKLEMERYDELYEKTGHPMMAMLRLLEVAAGPESGQYIHLGATTQDIMDTAMVLALKEMFDLARAKLVSIQNSVLDLCEKYADTPMIGRTHNVQALPITFGYKAAIWADELERCIQRLDQSRERILVLQMSGAVGSMVSFGNDGPAIQEKMAEELGIGVPAICWHASRDRLAEFVGSLALIGGCLGRIAQEVYLLMGTEYGELSEPWDDSKVGSSTMPHKVNPTSTQHMMSLVRDIRYHNAAVLEMMCVDHERNIMHFVGEREHIEECCVAAAELLDRADDLMAGLQVNEANMLANLNRLGGLTQSENIMLELGRKIGKQHAHELVKKIAVNAFLNNKNFEEELKKNETVTDALAPEQIHNLLDPMQYIGACPELARQITQNLRKE